jgi:hypothetical protein
MGVFLACALIFSSIQCVTSCVADSCKSPGEVPSCHRHSAPEQQTPAPCSHQVLVADSAPAVHHDSTALQVAIVPAANDVIGLVLPVAGEPVTSDMSPPGLNLPVFSVLRI